MLDGGIIVLAGVQDEERKREGLREMQLGTREAGQGKVRALKSTV